MKNFIYLRSKIQKEECFIHLRIKIKKDILFIKKWN